MEEYRHPIQAAEPFEESQGKDSATVVSPDDLAAFYKDMEKKEILERKLSKKSNAGTSIWSRKSVKRSVTAQPAPPPAHKLHQHNDPHDEQRQEEEARITVNHHDTDKPDWILPMNSPRSIIPDSKLPTSVNKDVWSSVPIPSHKQRYFIHNPVGPRWYKNHHLIPRSETTPAARPPSFFSPSFPPIASGSQDRLDDPTRIAGPSRTPSNSPLPTPNSSQTRVEDKPRTRKTSETAHDVVDLWDVTDPWGTNWHHPSPYDIGLVNGSISADVQEVLQTRSRSSMDQSRGRTVAPSPLSQSTTAVNLQGKPEIQIPRKLSKRRRTPSAASVFGRPSQDTGRHAAPSPITPVDIRPSSSDLPKRMSVAAPPVGSSMATQPKKEKRGSVLGRLVKKFSLLTKPHTEPSNATDDWQHINTLGPAVDIIPRHSFEPSRQPSPEKFLADVNKRVPPPDEEPHHVEPKEDTHTSTTDSASVVSVEAPFSIGRLTVANPDAPASGETTPGQGPVPLPMSKEPEYVLHSKSPEPIFPSTPQLDSNPPVPPEKSPPSPTPPTPPTPLMKLNKNTVSELISSPPIVIRQPSSLDRRSSGPVTLSESLENPPSIISYKSQASFGDSDVPDATTEKSQKPPTHSSRPTSSSRKPPPPFDTLASQPPLHPAVPAAKTARPESIASTVPFPVGDSELKPHPEYDNSPLSAVSVLANPPTPYANAEIAVLLTPQQPPPLPLKITTDLPSRQTETFRLIRSPSGHVLASSEKIVAGGEQWEVIGTPEKAKNKGSSSSKEQTPKDSEPPTSESRDRRHKDRDAKNVKDYAGRDHDPRHSTKIRDSRDKGYARDRDRDYVRDSRDREYVRDSRDKEYRSSRDYFRDSRDRDYTRYSRDGDYHRDSRDHKRESQDKDYHRDSRHRDYPRERDRDYPRESRDKEHTRSSRDREHNRSSKDKERPRLPKEREGDNDHRHKSRESKEQSHRDRESSGQHVRKHGSRTLIDPEVEMDTRRRHRSRRDSKSGGEPSTTVPKVVTQTLEADARYQRTTVPVEHEINGNDHRREEPQRKLTRKRQSGEPLTTVPKVVAQTLEADARSQRTTAPVEHEINGNDHRREPQRKLTRKRQEPSTTSSNVSPSKAQPAVPPSQDGPTTRLLVRHPSVSIRPTSQLPSADELNAMRAKEAWDMERLWKARSMQGDELNGYSTMPTIPSNHNTPLMGNISPPGPSTSSLYGSSHTAFLVQTPFQPSHSIYHSMPAAPPPILYSSPTSIPTVAHQPPLTSHRKSRPRIYADS